MSGGTPTKLVRDGDVESYDDPPAEPPVGVPRRLEADPSGRNGSDMRRADDAEAGDPYDAQKAIRASMDLADRQGGPDFEGYRDE